MQNLGIIWVMVLCVSGIANAGTIALYSTGYSVNDTELLPTIADGNWSIISTPSGPTSAPAYVTCCYVAPPLNSLSQGPFKNGWMANSGLSEWISPTKLETSSNAAGYYTYQATFYLDPSFFDTATITGEWTADNAGYVEINGVQVTAGTTGNIPTNTSGAFKSFHPFSLDSSNADFVPGINTIEFVAYNNGNGTPNVTGIDVDIEDTFVVPEPGSFALMGLGLSALAVAAKKRLRR